MGKRTEAGGCGSGCGCNDGAPDPDQIETFGPPPATSGPEWEAWADEVLATADADTDLGKDLARDAFRVASGELSKAAFHDRHESAVLKEFGVDERPTRAATRDGGDGRDPDGDPIPRIPDPDDGIDRRSMLKAGGLTAGFLALGTGADAVMRATGGGRPSIAAAEGGEEVQLGMAIDMERCIACLLCMEGCKSENNTSEGANWMHVFRFSEDDDDDMDGSMPRPCQHCSEPSCTYVCPTQARFKRDDDGIVLTDYDLCIGCRYCEVGCPYGVNYFEWGEPTEEAGGFGFSVEDRNDQPVAGNNPEGVMGKCTFCVHRQDDATQRGTTACADDCPVDAIHFGDMHDRDSDPRSYMREKEGESRFKLLDDLGNEPNVVYLGEKPSKDAEPIDGPFTYEDLGMEKLGEHAGRGEQP